MQEKWILENKKADFDGLSVKLGVSPLIVKCMTNRGLENESQMRKYLYGNLDDSYNPHLMKDIDLAVDIILAARDNSEKIAIASDYDCDGIFSGFVLWKAFSRIGLDAKIFTPDRISEGYGINKRIVDDAKGENRNIIVTCDNGIAAFEALEYAYENEIKVIVTDHHEIQEKMPKALAIVDPKREDETYPFNKLCGAGVAYKLIEVLYEKCKIDYSECRELLEYVAIATIADVMELVDENRILVKEGLSRLQNTPNKGLKALIAEQGLADREITAGHIGFIIGPCFNAAGRISSVAASFDLLMEEDEKKAVEKAKKLKELNESRKAMTEEGTKLALEMIENESLPKVILLVLENVHESLVGIIAGRIKEKYNHPVIVFTSAGEGLIKGSGRSIEKYNMFEELMKCKDLMVRFGGHKMAAGMTLYQKDFEELKERLNQNAKLTEEDFRPVIRIDAAMPIGYATEKLISEFNLMEPFGVANTKPIFAEQHFKILSGRKLGKDQNVLKMRVENQFGSTCDAMIFRQVDEFEKFVVEEWGEAELKRMYEGRENDLDIAFTYQPEVNNFNGKTSIQMYVKGYCRINEKSNR